MYVYASKLTSIKKNNDGFTIISATKESYYVTPLLIMALLPPLPVDISQANLDTVSDG